MQRHPDHDEPSAPAAASPPQRRLRIDPRGAWVRFGLMVVIVLPIFVMWSLTTVMFGSPDETAHMVRAQSFAAFDFTQPYTTDGIPIEAVECFRFRPEITAACQDLSWGEPGTQLRVPTRDYPPLYHAVAAVPALFSSGLAGAYLMRMWMATVLAALFAWAGVIATRPGSGPWPFVGLVLAFTPMVPFTSGTVNTTGMAAAGAALFTVALLAVARQQPHDRGDRMLLAALAVGALALVTSRRDGLLWFVLVVAVLSPVLPLRRWAGLATGPLRRNRPALIGALAALALLVVASVRWAGPTAQRFLRNYRDGEGGELLEILRTLHIYLQHLVGQLGWLDTPVGSETVLTVFALAGFVLVAAIATAPARLAASTALGLTALLVTPVLFGLVRFPYLQGRYLVPIWVALAVIAGAALGRGDLTGRATRRAVPLVLVPWLAIHVFALITNLRRYAVGRNGPWNVMTEPEWSPPMMSNGVAMLLIALSGLAALVAGVALVRPLLAAAGGTDQGGGRAEPRREGPSERPGRDASDGPDRSGRHREASAP